MSQIFGVFTGQASADEEEKKSDNDFKHRSVAFSSTQPLKNTFVGPMIRNKFDKR